MFLLLKPQLPEFFNVDNKGEKITLTLAIINCQENNKTV